MKNLGPAYIFLVVVLVFLHISCDGPSGPDGKDAEDFDHYAPEVSVVSPFAGQEVFEDTLTLLAKVEDDTEIERVLFTVAGTSVIGTDSALVTDSPYVYLWDFNNAGNSFGMLDVIATAWDTNGNSAISPMILFERKPRSGLDTLCYFKTSGIAYKLLVPDTTTLRIETEEDSVREMMYDVALLKYIPGYQCKLKSVDVNLTSVIRGTPDNYDDENDLWLILYSQDSEGKPLAPMDSALVTFNDFLHNRWYGTPVENFTELTADIEFGPDNPIMIGIRADVNLPVSVPYRGVAVNSILKTNESDPVFENHIFRRNHAESDSTWTVLYSSGNKKNLVVPALRVIVDYQGSN